MRYPKLPLFFITALLVGASFSTSQAAPVITATKDDNTAAGVRKSPGNTITYTTTISNTGDATATAVQLADPDPANTTFVSVNSTPIARNDAYSTVGNVQISVPAGSGLLVNDNDSDDSVNGAGAKTVTAVNTAGTQGNVSFNADGSFTFNPAVGFEGSTTFGYTFTDNEGSTDTATVTITIAGSIWFIQNGGAAGDGRLSTPFNSIAAFQAVNNGTGTNPSAGDSIFVYENASVYVGTLTLLNNQKLIGQDATADLATITGLAQPTHATYPVMNSGNGTTTTLTTSVAATNAVNLAVGATNTIRGLSFGVTTGAAIASGASFGTLTISDVSKTGGGQALALTSGTLAATFNTLSSTSSVNAVSLTTIAGSLTATGGAISGASGDDFLVSGGAASITYPGTITNTVGRPVNISGKTGGTVLFSGAISDTGTGISLTSNTGATINFTGGITSNTGANTAFNATGGGTISVTGTNTIGATTALSTTAVNIANTTIGSNGMIFSSIAVNGGAGGIILNTTGAGPFTVSGTGSAGTGGTIQNTTGRGASFTSASNISLSWMNFTNAGTTDLAANNSGLSDGHATVGNNTNAAIHLQTVTTALLDNVNISGGAEQGIYGHTVANFRLTNSAITNVGNAADEDNIHFFNMSGSSAIINTTLTHTSGGGDDNLNLQTTSGNLDLVISGGSAVGVAGGVNNLGSGYLFGIRGTTVANINFDSASSTNHFSGGIVADAFDSAVMNLRVNNSTSSGNNDQLSVSAGDNSSVDLEATGNTLSSVATGDFVVISLLGSAFDNGFTFDARIHSNNITVANNLTADGMLVFNAGGGAMNVAITNNTFDYAGSQRGIAFQTGQDGAGLLRATVTGNTMDIKLDGTSNAVNGILAQSGVADPSGAGSIFDGNIGGAGALANTFTHSLGGTLAGGDIRVRQRFSNNINLDGYGGGATDTAAVATYLDGRNTEVSPSTASFLTGSYSGTASPRLITVAVSVASVLEDGGTNLVYTFTRNGSTAASLVANFAITGTATAGTDFTVTGATSFTNGTGLGTITFAAGSATTAITVDPTADSDATEFDEVVVVDAGNSTTANGSFARGVITDDSPLSFASGGVEATPASASADLTFTNTAAPGSNVSDRKHEAAGERSTQPGNVSALTQRELNKLVVAALQRWKATGLTGEQLATLNNLKFEVTDLPGLHLGEAGAELIRVDNNAGGNGWFVDATPADDVEFSSNITGTRRYTDPSGAPAGRIDLLSTILHEMGHALGLCDTYAEKDRDNLMYGFLTKGERRLPSARDAVIVSTLDGVPHAHAHTHFLSTPLAIGDLPASKTVTITYVVTINPATTAISTSSQGTVSGGGFTTKNTNDPQTGTADDATVTPIHQPPVVTNVAASVNEDAILTFAAANFTGSYSDPNSDALTSVRITSLPANGVLKVGVTTVASVPTDVAIASIATLTYTPTGDYNGSDSFGWNGFDGTLYATSNATVNLTVNPVNDNPALASIEGSTVAYTENDAATPITASLTVADIDSANLASATVSVTTNYANGQDVLGFVNQLGITGSFDAPSGVLTLSGTTSVANYQTALRAVTYQNTSDNPSTTTRTVRFQVNDGSGANNLSNTPTRNIAVTAVNDGPVLANFEGTPLAYSENDSATTISNTLTLNDADGPNIVSAMVVITSGHASGQDMLTVGTLPGGVTSNFTNGALTISGTAQTAATYQSILRTVKFQNTSESPSTAQRTVSFQVDDDSVVDNLSNIGSRDITVTSVNDAPMLNNLEGSTIAYTENDPAVAITAAISIFDLDNTSFVGATVIVAGNLAIGQDLLEFTDQNGISGSYDGNTGVLTLSGVATLADYETAMRSVTYRNTSDNPSTFTRTVLFQLNDGGAANNLSNAAARTIAVTASNDAPVIATQNAVSTAEETARLIDFADLNVTDPDNAYPTGFTLTVLAGTNYTFVGNTITPTTDFTGTLTVQVKVNDGANDSNTFGLSVSVTGVNDDPVAVADAAQRVATQSTKVRITTLLSNDTDVESNPLSLTSVQDALPAGATVTSDAKWVYYTPPSGSSAAGSFTYSISDGQGGTATGTVTVNVQTSDTETANKTKMQLENTGGGDQMHLYFLGIPGRTYEVQYTDSMAPTNWQTLTTVVADAQGKYEAIDPPPLPPSRFYRSIAP